jgi:uncharacterized membrane protein YphA (DoxX/SURF4 family)
MTGERVTFGWRVYGLGVLAMGMLCLVWGGFDPGQPVPKAFPARAVLGYLTAAFMVIAGAAVAWRRSAAWAGAALAGYFGVIVVLLMYGRLALGHPSDFSIYSGGAEQLAIAAAGLIVFAANARIEALPAARLARLGQMTFGVCAILFGAAHFVFLSQTVPLVPKWLPPSQTFWAYATGLAHIAAGLAILTGVQARLAAVLLTVMYAAFTPLVHLPLLLGDPSSHESWAENAENLALTGCAWVVADSLLGWPDAGLVQFLRRDRRGGRDADRPAVRRPVDERGRDAEPRP